MSHVCVNTAKTALFRMLASFHCVELELGVRGFFNLFTTLHTSEV